MAELNTRIVLRNDSTAKWLENSAKVLLKGEVGIEFLTDGTVKMKVGDGTKTWDELPYFGGAESQIFEATLQDGETKEDAIARVVGSVAPVKGAIAIVKALISGDKYEYTGFVYNGTAWVAMDGNYSVKNVYFDADMTLTKAFGKYTPDSTGSVVVPSNGDSLYDVIMDAYSEESNPSIEQPSATITASLNKAYEVGAKVSPTYTVNFDSGNYQYGTKTDTSGATGVTATSYAVSDTAGNTATTKTGTMPEVTVTDGMTYRINATVTYSDGGVPVTNLGNEYAAGQIKGGTVTASQSSSISGYRSYFYGVLSTATADAPLTSAIIRGMTNGGNYNAGKTFTLNGSATAKRIVIAIPSSSSRGGLKEVILTSAMNTPVTDSYVKTEAAVKVEGLNGATAVDYDVWVYEPSKIDAGEVHKITLA